jgi:hypothetical protein
MQRPRPTSEGKRGYGLRTLRAVYSYLIITLIVALSLITHHQRAALK